MPEVLKRRYVVIDETVTVNDNESFQMVHELMEKENLFPGPSAGAVMAGIQKVAEPFGAGPIVAIFGDDASKYKSVYSEFSVVTEEVYEKLEKTSRFGRNSIKG
jgi:cysteine synthase